MVAIGVTGCSMMGDHGLESWGHDPLCRIVSLIFLIKSIE